MSTATHELLDGHPMREIHTTHAVEGTTSADQTACVALPSCVGGTHFPSGRARSDAQTPDAAGGPSHLTGRGSHDAQVGHAREATTSPAADSDSGPRTDARQGSPLESDRSANLSPEPSKRALADPTLALAADVVDDLERVKIANQNRLRALTRDVEDSDGEMRGFGLDESHPAVAQLAALVTMIEAAEAEAVKNLQRAMRKHPLGPWVKAQKGVGEKQAARLLAKIGDPYINSATGEPRTVSALWAYCGLHVIDGESARRRKGQQANWSTLAKTRSWLIIQSAMKQLDAQCKTDTGIANHVDDCTCSPYRVAIDERRHRTAETHPDWTPGHSLNDAQRVASKALLRDLWIEARRIHTERKEEA